MVILKHTATAFGEKSAPNSPPLESKDFIFLQPSGRSRKEKVWGDRNPEIQNLGSGPQLRYCVSFLGLPCTWPQVRRLKTTRIYSLVVLEARGARSRGQQGRNPSESSRGGSPSAPAAPSGPWSSSVYGSITAVVSNKRLFVLPPLAFLSSHLCGSSPLLTRTLVIGFKAHPQFKNISSLDS